MRGWVFGNFLEIWKKKNWKSAWSLTSSSANIKVDFYVAGVGSCSLDPMKVDFCIAGVGSCSLAPMKVDFYIAGVGFCSLEEH